MQVFKMIVKVLAVVVVTAIATPYLFGFVGGLFDSLSAGYTAGILVVCTGLFAIGNIIFKGIRRDCGGKENQGEGQKCDEP